MKYKTLFRLLVKWLGVWTVVTGVTGLASGLFYTIATWSGSPSMGMSRLYTLSSPLSALLHIGLGLYLFYGGEWIVNAAILSNHPYCPECGYDLSHLPGPVCPECGTHVGSQGSQS